MGKREKVNKLLFPDDNTGMDTMKIVIPDDLKRQFKKACVDHDANMSAVVCNLVTLWLEGKVELNVNKPDQG